MTYQETLKYLYEVTPLFQQKGGSAYKPGLQTTEALDAHFGHPHRRYATLHIAGTNGKGSCAHTLAAYLQQLGFRTGLYTSPHLLDFRERIRINGRPVPEQYVVDFVEQERPFFEPLHPSFFEVTTAMAFKYFADEAVDIAVIEVGLGGRLDCTNIITPLLSVITNISLDHTQFLGHTAAAIAGEKAGIIKPGVPVVIGEATAETRPVFEAVAQRQQAPIIFAEDTPQILQSGITDEGLRRYRTRDMGIFDGVLSGSYQQKNAETLLHVFQQLCHLPLIAERGNQEEQEAALRAAFQQVDVLTGLHGRWEQLDQQPDIVCDAGHNIGGWQYLSTTLGDILAQGRPLHVVFGMMADKDVDAVLSLLPCQAHYYFTQADLPRAMKSSALADIAARHHLEGYHYDSVAAAIAAARKAAKAEDFIYIGGSCFVVAEALPLFTQPSQ